MGGCYTPEPLTAKLISYRDNVMGKESTFLSAADNIATEINSSNTDFTSATSGISANLKDAQGAALTQCLTLVSEACTRMRDSVNNDIGSICSKCTDVDTTLQALIDKQKEASQIPRSYWIEEAWDDLGHFISGHWNNSNHGRFQSLNQEIKQQIKLCEAKIDAIASASYQIQLGIDSTNMVRGGSLGNYISFDSVYSFNEQQWLEENPIVNLNILQQAGCLVVGAVEGVAKIVEGVVDCAASVVGGVVSAIGTIFNWDAAKNAADAIKDFVKEDWVGKGAAAVGKLITGSEAAYRESFGAKAGNFIGSAVGHGVLWCIPGGALISAAAIAGNKMESEFQNGADYGTAILKGTLYGAASYGLGKAMPYIMNGVSHAARGVTSRLSQSAVGKAVTGFVARHPMIQTATKVVAWPFKKAVGAAGKVLNGYNKLVTKIGGAITKRGWYSHTLANWEAAIDNAGARLVGRAENALQQRQLNNRLAKEAEIRQRYADGEINAAQRNKEIMEMRQEYGGHNRTNAYGADEANATNMKRSVLEGMAENGYVTDDQLAHNLTVKGGTESVEALGRGSGHIPNVTGNARDTLNFAVNRGTLPQAASAMRDFVGPGNWNPFPTFHTTVVGGTAVTMAENAKS